MTSPHHHKPLSQVKSNRGLEKNSGQHLVMFAMSWLMQSWFNSLRSQLLEDHREKQKTSTSQETVSTEAIETLESPAINLPQETETSESIMNELSKTVDKSNESKTFFDWTEAILLPLVLALFGASFTVAQFMITNQREDADSAAKAIEMREQVLTDYGKTIAELVTEYKLGQQSDQSIKDITRGQTLIALRRLNVSDDNSQAHEARKLKGLLILYLFDAKLINNHPYLNREPLINLSQGDLNNVVLDDAWLQDIDLGGSELRESSFKNSNLMRANLKDANLQGANLQGANLKDANLKGANLQGANLQGANLKDANLEDAKQIKQACYWEKAIYTPTKFDRQKRQQVVANEAANQQEIEKLKRDKASDPKQTVDCRYWQKHP